MAQAPPTHPQQPPQHKPNKMYGFDNKNIVK
jgi:hypothetical protein